MEKLVIAIDGYSSCGKSTVAKAIARRLGLPYVDSGAMYRAVTLYFLNNEIPIPQNDKSEYNYKKHLGDIDIQFEINPNNGISEIVLNGKNVESEIRKMRVSKSVSQFSTLPSVRKMLVEIQRNMGAKLGLVMDGRDIGTVVFPNADLKFFMTASGEVRAKRRYEELMARGLEITMDEVQTNLNYRDYQDSHREISPLKQAEDAIVLDNSAMNQDEQLDFVMKYVEQWRKNVST
ncbi:MAG: (d)CMP kinase [Bacteroidia bacterium]|nr:(d)CMP kinase [Bacteroidia bacterium]